MDMATACGEMAAGQVPHYHADFYDDAFIADPFGHYAAMRALGPVVYLPTLGNYAVTQYREVREALRHFETFSSAQGVAADQTGCDFMRGVQRNTLNSDPPEHDVMRGAVAAPLLPGALEAIRGRIELAAERLVDKLLAKGDFDGMADLARHLPVSIVTDLVGLAEHGRENMLEWAAASFDILGIQNERGRRGMETAKEMRAYILAEGVPEKLKPGSWTARLHELADQGQITREMCPMMFRDYIAPSLDTTISATGHLFHLLGRHPETWGRIRRDPALIPGAVNEAVRLGSPIRSFSRTLTRAFELGGATLPEGARVMCLYASANRDERRFPDPDRFDPTRPGTYHVGFGHGIHQCVGMHLARLEMESLLRAMVPRVARFEVGEPTVGMNNTIYGFATMPMRLVAGVPVAATMPATQASLPKPDAPIPPVSAWRAVRVVHRQAQTADIASFELVAADGGSLSAFTAGAHVDVEVAPGLVRQYSLCNDPAESTRRYRIAVLRDAASRGGSRAVHDAWQAGHPVRIGTPRNSFPLDEAAEHTVLIAGGVGITPMLAMAYRLHALGRGFTLHYCARSQDRAAFLPEMEASGLAPFIRLHLAVAGRFSTSSALGDPVAGTHVYCCGPQRLMDAVAGDAAALGWPAARIHLERFRAPVRGDDTPFTLVAHRSGLTLDVPAGQTMLDVLTAAGVDVPSSCCAGVCATCLVDVVCGVPDHRDMVLTAGEKAANRQVAVCCSRSVSRTLVLDI